MMRPHEGPKDAWALGPQGETLQNGVHMGKGYATEFDFLAGAVYALGTDGHWYRWTGTEWSQQGLPPPIPELPPDHFARVQGFRAVERAVSRYPPEDDDEPEEPQQLKEDRDDGPEEPKPERPESPKDPAPARAGQVVEIALPWESTLGQRLTMPMLYQDMAVVSFRTPSGERPTAGFIRGAEWAAEPCDRHVTLAEAPGDFRSLHPTCTGPAFAFEISVGAKQPGVVALKPDTPYCLNVRNRHGRVGQNCQMDLEFAVPT